MARFRSITRKFLMAVSGLFLLLFLTQHLSINLLSVVSEDAFNQVSHFMGTNPLVQFLLQPVLIFGFMFHLIMGMVLEYQNRQARPVEYAGGNKATAPWVSKNMIYTGIMVMLFLGLHFADFFIPELEAKYFAADGRAWGYTVAEMDKTYYDHLVHEFENPIRVGLYVLAFLFLGLHLAHGFQSAFQSVGANHPKYTPLIKKLGFIYAVVVPIGFGFIAIYHFLTH